jgi:hypothetical protein
MDHPAFESQIQSLAAEIPAEFLAGVAEIAVSPRTVPHPDHPDIFTLGECVALPATSDDPDAVVSRVVLYYGSFAALARDDPDFDWEDEAWETLTHEVRHHVEWRARESGLESQDEAAEENYSRQVGGEYDPLFYRDGEPVAHGVFRVEDDYFIEVASARVQSGQARIDWAGKRYRVALPADLEPPALLTVRGLADPPRGEVILVVRSRHRWREVRAEPVEGEVEAVPEW